MDRDFEYTDEDIEQQLIMMMTFTSLAHNKILSPVAFFLLLLEDKDLQRLAMHKMEMSLFDIIKHLGRAHPVLHKSRKVQKFITTTNLQLSTQTRYDQG